MQGNEPFDLFEVLAYSFIIACVLMVPLMLLLEKVSKRKLTPIEGDVPPDFVIKPGDVIQFHYPHSARIGTGKVINFYPFADKMMVRVAHLDTPSSNRRISSVSLEDDVLKLIATEADTKAEEVEEEEVEIMAL